MTRSKQLLLAAAVAGSTALVSGPADAFFGPMNWMRGGGWGPGYGWGGPGYGYYPYSGWGYPYGGWGYPYGGWGHPYGGWGHPYGGWGYPLYSPAVAAPATTSSDE
jgi:hypothetical protein